MHPIGLTAKHTRRCAFHTILVGVNQPMRQRDQTHRIVDLADRPSREDAAQKTQFVSIHVAEPREHALVEQCEPHGTAWIRGEIGQRNIRVPVGAEDVGAKIADDRLLVLGLDDFEYAERVPDRHPIRGLEHRSRAVRRTPPLRSMSVQMPRPLHL